MLTWDQTDVNWVSNLVSKVLTIFKIWEVLDNPSDFEQKQTQESFSTSFLVTKKQQHAESFYTAFTTKMISTDDSGLLRRQAVWRGYHIPTFRYKLRSSKWRDLLKPLRSLTSQKTRIRYFSTVESSNLIWRQSFYSAFGKSLCTYERCWN
jgi:hypothetical protein